MIEKKSYIKPEIEIIKLDNEISLALESNPIDGPGESYIQTSDFIKNNPYKNQLG